MNRKLTFVFAVMLAILLPMTLGAQEKKGGGGKKGMGATTELKGCFNPGSDADHFTLKTEDGKTVTVTGDAAKLAPHAKNHNVTLTGTMEGKDTFKASDLKMNQPAMCK